VLTSNTAAIRTVATLGILNFNTTRTPLGD